MEFGEGSELLAGELGEVGAQAGEGGHGCEGGQFLAGVIYAGEILQDELEVGVEAVVPAEKGDDFGVGEGAGDCVELGIQFIDLIGVELLGFDQVADLGLDGLDGVSDSGKFVGGVLGLGFLGS